MSERHFIFPLGTVLFPGGLLPLRIFEQRYLDMTKTCLRETRPFGVCLIREGAEVGTPAVPEKVGCLAKIESWEMPQLGVFHLLARGSERFRLLATEVASNGLITGTLKRIGPDRDAAPVDDVCRSVLEAIIERGGAARFGSPLALDDAAWVGYRLAEILPLEAQEKQRLLELEDSGARLERLRALLIEGGLIQLTTGGGHEPQG